MDIQSLMVKVKAAGGRDTKVRRLFLSLFLLTKHPLTAPEITKKISLQIPSLQRSTVYREIDFLLAAGIVREIRLCRQIASYELALDHHHHLVCLKCRKIKPVVLSNHLRSEEERIMKQEDFKITEHALEFYGLCSKCQKL
jgi:Fe2+ or Zn2+ uptake regulation protein